MMQLQRCNRSGRASVPLQEKSSRLLMTNDVQVSGVSPAAKGPLDEMDNLLGQVTDLLSSVSEMLCDEHM